MNKKKIVHKRKNVVHKKKHTKKVTKNKNKNINKNIITINGGGGSSGGSSVIPIPYALSSQQVPNFNISIPERMYPVNEPNNLTNVLGKEPNRVVNDLIKTPSKKEKDIVKTPKRMTPIKPFYNDEDFMNLEELINNKTLKLLQKEGGDKSFYDAVNESYSDTMGSNLRKKTPTVESLTKSFQSLSIPDTNNPINNPMNNNEDVVVPKPRGPGRPVGSKDTKPRQRKQPLRQSQQEQG
jgi:hypothetical protein